MRDERQGVLSLKLESTGLNASEELAPRSDNDAWYFDPRDTIGPDDLRFNFLKSLLVTPGPEKVWGVSDGKLVETFPTEDEARLVAKETGKDLVVEPDNPEDDFEIVID